MTHLAELLQWDRFITPSIIRVFYWLCLAMTALAGLSLILTALGMMAINLVAGLLLLVASMIFILTGIIFVRRSQIGNAARRRRRRRSPCLPA